MQLRSRGSAVAIAVAVLVGSAISLSTGRAEDGPARRLVERVVDGDTLVLDGGERVRLIGVDTPETVHPNKPVERFGKEASAFTRARAEGKRVRLEYDVERLDRYGRTLAYVWMADDSLLNLEIIRLGYGHAYTRFPFEKIEVFRAAEREAREEGRGLWNGNGRAAAPDLEPDLEPAAQGSCRPRSECCKVCSRGKACGDGCIRASYTCRRGSGCACDASEVCAGR